MAEETVVKVEEKQEVEVSKDRLTELGFTMATSNLELAKKMKIAYDNYLFVSQEKIDAFNEKLRIDTLKEDKRSSTYKRLKFTNIKDYTTVPPASVLDALESAQKRGCFDTFEIAKIEWHTEVKDPILFAKINGCSDFFFISQWDDDVHFEDILFLGVK